MNRYQQEVAEMDRQHATWMRALAVAGVATLIGATLWSANWSIAQWWSAAQRRLQHDTSESISPPAPTSIQAPSAGVPSVATPRAETLPGTDSSVSREPLALWLISTAPGRSDREGTARVGTDRSNPQTYVAGAVLANGATLVEIHRDHVVLQRNGVSATLHANAARRNHSQDTDLLLTVGGDRVPQPAVATMRETLVEYIRPNPVYDADLIKGYEVYSGPKAGIFAQLGLRNGDLILALDGAPFSDPQQAMSMFRQLTDGVALVASIDRKGKRERIVLDGALIAADQARMSDAQSSSPVFHPPEAIASQGNFQ